MVLEAGTFQLYFHPKLMSGAPFTPMYPTEPDTWTRQVLRVLQDHEDAVIPEVNYVFRRFQLVPLCYPCALFFLLCSDSLQ